MYLPTSLPDARFPQSYEAAKTALAECTKIDECQDWANKAEALASYAKQADDDTLRKLADRIQARAVRRCGELLQQFNAQGRRSDLLVGGASHKSRYEAGHDAGMSDDQIKGAVRVANINGEDFEAAVESDKPPTITKLAEMGKTARPAPEGFKEATKLLGRVRDFAEFCEENDPALVANGVMSYERDRVLEHMKVIGAWLARFSGALTDELS